MKSRFVWAALILCHQAFAQVDPYTYRLNGLRVVEDASTMSIEAPVPLDVQILAGGHTWPLLSLDEEGRIYAGDRVVSAAQQDTTVSNTEHAANEQSILLPYGYRITADTKAYRITHGANACTLTPRQLGLDGHKPPLQALKYSNVVFRASNKKLLALGVWLGIEKSDTRYSMNDIDPVHCRVRRIGLGNPDLLVELNTSSRGGWWIVGSIEQTLLHSKDGRHWRPIVLPHDLSSLVSAYFVDPHTIWLAGNVLGNQDDDPLLVYSDNGGKTWRRVGRADPLLERLPVGWLEGQRRLGRPIE